MLRKLLLALMVLVIVTGSAQAVDQQFVYKNTALDTNSTLVLFGIQAKTVLIQNRNAPAGIGMYIDFLGNTATSADFELIAGASIQVTSSNQRGGFGRIAIVAASGATTSVQILAVN